MARTTSLHLLILLFLAGPLAALPVDIILSIDNSGSMKKNDPGFLTRETVAGFVARLDDEQQAGLLLFGTQARFVSGLTSPQKLNRAIHDGALNKINFSDQWTDTAAALEMALYEHKMNGRDAAESVIILLTDGIVDTGNAEDSQRRRQWIIGGLAQQANQAGVRIFGIAFTQAADFELLQALAQGTGGDYYRILAVADMAAVFEKIRAQLAQNTAGSADPVPADESFDALAEFAINFSEPDSPKHPASPQDLPSPPAAELAVAEPSSTQIPVFSGRGDPDNAPASDPKNSVAVDTDNKLSQTEQAAEANSSVAGFFLWPAAVLVGLTGGILVWSRTVKINRKAPEALLHDLEKVTGATTVDLTGKQTRIGRAPGRARWWQRPQLLVLDNVGISRLHAIIEYRDDDYWLIDQNSKNGCMVNHERSRLPKKLASGDKLHIARLEFIFELPHPDESDETVLFGQ